MGIAVFAYDSGLNTLTLTDFMYKMGSEEIKFSKDEKYIFSANGVSGLLIVDIFTTRGKLKLVSQIMLEGWASSITLL